MKMEETTPDWEKEERLFRAAERQAESTAKLAEAFELIAQVFLGFYQLAKEGSGACGEKS